MKVIPFEDFVARKGQAKAASLLGVTQGAISKALRAGRKINVFCHDDGSYSAEEIKPFPNQAAKAVA
ncbi:Cro/CI family transcriptional regulator [Pseudomonas aeruginosa]|uniref:Cro/CI family transcriptional regulator n=1 Tax=Pseudomonas aeruginosa TaxID=287 RepID=UPI00053E2829|nr:Cro/CI family transcriptional regulator [Pseudomonas aeruginosa]HBO1051445.1 hypothetical protein [Pseudomonas aeruginosa]HBO9140676.1 hypothetical protein [Pseudomonas aeruginosa]HBP5061263.1 hypothetical protein [Pseudomonas aeruginosa]